MPTPALAHDHRPVADRTVLVDGQAMPYGDLPLWSSIATLSGLPSTAFPLGLSPQGLPVGAQAIGPSWRTVPPSPLPIWWRRPLAASNRRRDWSENSSLTLGISPLTVRVTMQSIILTVATIKVTVVGGALGRCA